MTPNKDDPKSFGKPYGLVAQDRRPAPSSKPKSAKPATLVLAQGSDASPSNHARSTSISTSVQRLRLAGATEDPEMDKDEDGPTALSEMEHEKPEVERPSIRNRTLWRVRVSVERSNHPLIAQTELHWYQVPDYRYSYSFGPLSISSSEGEECACWLVNSRGHGSCRNYWTGDEITGEDFLFYDAFFCVESDLGRRGRETRHQGSSRTSATETYFSQSWGSSRRCSALVERVSQVMSGLVWRDGEPVEH
jgi:hypothetical protein